MKPELIEREICGLRCLCHEAPEKGVSPGILFLHGAGSRNSMEQLRRNPFFTAVSRQITDFAVIAPLLVGGSSWFDVFEHLIALSRCAAQEMNCDPDRLALMGTSMGGFGSWQLAMSNPDPFCALVPLCGGGTDWSADRLKSIPVHAYHGATDTVVDPFYSRKMVDSVNAKGGHAELTLYPGIGHNCWDLAYRDEALFQWLKSVRRTKSAADGMNAALGAKNYG